MQENKNTTVLIMGAGGRMGSTIADLVKNTDGLELKAVIERPNYDKDLSFLHCQLYTDTEKAFKEFAHQNAVVIDFTSPEASIQTARLAAQYEIAHVMGTTGLNEAQKKELTQLAQSNRIFWSPNMSIGINVLLEVLPILTQLLGDNYDTELVELHHNMKKDSPSGTALRLAECIAEAKNWKLPEVANYHREGIIGERPHEEIGIQTIRGGDVVGVHTVYFMAQGERIEVTHQAHSRQNFAQGAVRAAKWITHQTKGQLYTMADMLKA